ncbi:hypothetical protein OROGR_004954 [Orobanche gracilis]
MAEGEIEYESDPEEAKLTLNTRRREASDDEAEGGKIGYCREKLLRKIDDPDGESEGAAEYEGDLDEEDEQEYDLNEEYVGSEIEELEEYEKWIGAKMVAMERVESGKEGEDAVEEEKGVGEVDDEDNNVAESEHEERKEVESSAVPTAGAFYMHDDRFRDNAGGRHGRTLGGRKIWESKDDRKWGHDKFEELTMHEMNNEDRRTSRGRNRGRGKNRGSNSVNAHGNRPSNNSTQNNNNQSNAPKNVRGRGPRRYQQYFRNSNEVPVTQNKLSGKSIEKHSYVSSARTTEPVSSAKSDVAQPRKQVAPSLNIASPPFYPIGSSTKDDTVPLKRNVQAGVNRNGQQSAADVNFTMSQSIATMRGKNIVDSIGVENLYIDNSPSGQPPLRGQGRGLTSSTQMAYQPAVSRNQFNRGPPSQIRNIQRNSGQIHVQSSVHQGTQRLRSGSQAFYPPKAAGGVNAFESGDLEYVSESKSDVVSRGKGSVEGSLKGPVLYGGTQVMRGSGGMGSAHIAENFPAFLPVMQFGGQHPGGIGVPAVGMAFPGYVGQPQLGLGSSEMTWLPVLAGAAGALGASYCPPYITMDGSYNARPSGHASSIAAALSKENNAANIENGGNPAQRPGNDELGQRQNNPRRYTEMKFDR